MKRKLLSLILALCFLIPTTGTMGENLVGEALTLPIKVQMQTLSMGGATLIVRPDGSLWGTGDNYYGELGDGTREPSDTFKEIMRSGVRSVSTASQHSLIVKSDNTLWGCGTGYRGSLTGVHLNDPVITPLKLMSNVLTACTSESTSFAIKTDGSLWGWGGNEAGQVGGSSEIQPPMKIMDNVVAVSASYGYTLAIKTDGSLWGWGSKVWESLDNFNNQSAAYTKTPVKLADGVAAVSTDDSGYAYLKTDGNLYVYGNNIFGQLGTGQLQNVLTPVCVMSGVSHISMGVSNTYAIKDGEVYGCGLKDAGQLGEVTKAGYEYSFVKIKNLSGVTAISAGTNNVLVQKSDGTFWGWGNVDGYLSDLIQIPNMTGVQSVSCGIGYTMCIRSDKSLWGWGANTFGRLGDGTKNNKLLPVKIMSDIKLVDAGYFHTMAVGTDGSLWAWGDNEYGQLGNGTLLEQMTPVKILNSGVASVSVGDGYSLVVMENGELYACGKNDLSQLGDGTTTDRNTLTKINLGESAQVISACAGIKSSFAITADHRLFAWGDNEYSQLGDGTEQAQSTPIAVMEDVRSVSGGDTTTLVVKTNSELWGWGRNGELLLKYYWSYGSLIPYDEADQGKGFFPPRRSYPPCKLLSNVRTASLNNDYVAAVTNNNEMYHWGGNGLAIYAGGWIWDLWKAKMVMENVRYTAQTKPFTRDPETHSDYELQAYGFHEMFIKTDGTLWGWSNNYVGQLGIGTAGYTDTPRQIQFVRKNPVVQSISLSKLPTKVNYIKGEALSLTGANLLVNYDNGSKQAVALTTDMVSGYNKSKAGTQILTVTYQNKKTSFKVTVFSYVAMRIGYTRAIANGTKTTVDNAGTKPLLIQSKTMVPLRFVGEKLGAKVTYTTDKEPIYVVYDSITVEIKLGSKIMKVIRNGKTMKYTLDVAPQKVGGKTFVPLRALSTAIGYNVYYQASSKAIIISMPAPPTTLRDQWLAAAKSYITK